ncbi:MAG: RNA polymerase sigma factor [Candidatus Latescibacterota bacterium]
MTDDHDIMIAVRDGEIRQLGVLFQRHSKHLFNFFLAGIGNRDASEDLVQDVFLRMLKYRHTYRDSANFMVWMFTIARNVRTDYYRKKGSANEPIEYRDDYAGHNPGSEETIGEEDEARLVRKALARMPDDSRELLVLSKFKNMRYREIGTLLNCSEGAVKVRVFRAMQELKAMYHTLRGAEA